MSKNRNIVVFWIDEAPREDFVERLRAAGMQVFFADNYTDGLAWLKTPNNNAICDAVILDVNCKIRHSDTEESTDSFRDYAYRVMNQCDQAQKQIPWFVFTTASGYDASLLSAIPMREWTRRQYYRKDIDQETLINDIRELTKHADNIALRERYAGIFDLCQEQEMSIRLRDLVKKLESPDSTSDTTVFNALRKVMAFIVRYGREHGLFTGDIETIRDAQKRMRDICETDPETVPSYVASNFYSLCDTVNNGSHSRDEEDEAGALAVDADVLSGRAPYLTRAVFYQLLTILHWLLRLPVDEQEIKQLRERMELTFNDQIRLYEGRECHLQFDEGVWHYGQCAIRVRDGYMVSEQTLVRLHNVQPNKNYATRKRYPYYAHYDIVYTTLN